MTNLNQRIMDAYYEWIKPRLHTLEADHPADAFKAGYLAALPRWIPVGEGEPVEPRNYLVVTHEDEQLVMFHNGAKGFWDGDDVVMYLAYHQPPEVD